MEGWINCNKCNNRFRAFIQFCPQCGSQNPAYNNTHHSRIEFKKYKVSMRKTVVIIILAVVIIGSSVIVAWNMSIKNNDNNSISYYIIKPKTSTVRQTIKIRCCQ